MSTSAESPEPHTATARPNAWLWGLVALLLVAVAILVALLLRKSEPAAPATARALATPPASAPATTGPSAAPSAVQSPDAGAPAPWVNLLDPTAPPVQGAPPAPAPSPDPLMQAFGAGLGAIFDDPDLKSALKDLDKQLRSSQRTFGRLFGGRSGGAAPGPGGSGGGSGGGTPAPQNPSGSGVDLFADLMKRTLGLLKGLGTGLAPQADEIESVVREEGGRYVVVCRFPKGAPKTARFEVKVDKLVVTASFQNGEVQHEVELPGPAHPVGATSELRGGELIITLPKAS